jgi:hypothetical protein
MSRTTQIRLIVPMLATFASEPFHRPGWVLEEKYDGYRILAYKDGAQVRLVSRRGRDWTRDFAPIADAVAALPARPLILDGEVIVFDRQFVSRFELLRRRTGPLIYAVFDCPPRRPGRDGGPGRAARCAFELAKRRATRGSSRRIRAQRTARDDPSSGAR